MKLSKLTFAVVTVLGASLSSAAFAIDLYVDTKTKQIFSEPGKNRVKMGTFEEVKPAAPAVDKAEMDAIREDLELKNNAIKALEEKATAVSEDKKKDKEAWYNRISFGGYTQLRYNLGLSGDRGTNPALSSTGDGSIGNNTGFFLRRSRIKFSGDLNDYISLYLQMDLATGAAGNANSLHYAQLRDVYTDIHFDKAHEYRLRAGISKIPFGWENLQSSQNRIALDRNDALNSATPGERDLGLALYWTPTDVQKLWKKLMKNGLKPSGDYGVLGFAVFNGQGNNGNRPEANDNLYMVAHSTYPFELNFLGDMFEGQVLEVGVDAMSGRLSPTNATTTTTLLSPTSSPVNVLTALPGGAATSATMSEDRVAAHAILFPQPFGLQAEWNWGKSPTTTSTVFPGSVLSRQPLSGGYVQAMYKFDKVFGTEGTIIPYAKWQTYHGAWKNTNNAPKVTVREIEAGIEYQIMKALEFTVAYSYMDRVNPSNFANVDGNLLRMQLQWNY